ncbi:MULTISPECIES: ATP-dependent DNA helicase DinG [Giesbergeria]|uniref:ATP-dependent DNA helicase DinG n=1 Tax=Giesbergeria sinuosa TaxID=80883 RepID=A0ABV9QCX4_9BURK
MSSTEWADAALQAFDQVVQSETGLRSRPGQRRMAEQVAQTLSVATLGSPEPEGAAPVRAIAIIQAGTGVGKSLAYCAPAIAIALARNTRVLISTATVALQEQLIHKDLPALMAQMPQPFRFALAKGRGRYVCQLKLAQLAGGGPALPEEDDLFYEEETAARATRPAHETEARLRYYTSLAQSLAAKTWDGDRDTLDTPPAPELWAPVAAEAGSCTGKHCPMFSQCSYFDKRKELVAAQVIVVNHDLLLSTLGGRVLPELDNCLLVLDEAHHLPATALEQFACSMDLSRLLWIDRLAQRATRIGTLMELAEIADIPGYASQLRQSLQDVARLVMDLYGDALRPPADATGRKRWPEHKMPMRVRLPGGVLPEVLLLPLQQLAQQALGFIHCLSIIAKALRAQIREHPDEAKRLSTHYAQIGMLVPRLQTVHDTTQLLLQQPPATPHTLAVPHAKWFTLTMDGEYIALQAHASPLLPGATLRHKLWQQVRGAILTSATLTSCGQFDFFLRESGLDADEAATALEVPSPFDYARQGTLVAVATHADPKNADQFTPEMVTALLQDLAQVPYGALVLFTSREQMRQAVEALPPTLAAQVLVQNTLPRPQLLQRHRERVADGQASIIFGMQSFGEGLDLPGRLCESVFIPKLPFAPPDDPVGQARAEWLRTVERDPFNELVVPATAMRLAQWAGRAIRSEEDQAHVYCYDRRLTQTSYGKRLLAGLPPFTRVLRPAI